MPRVVPQPRDAVRSADSQDRLLACHPLGSRGLPSRLTSSALVWQRGTPGGRWPLSCPRAGTPRAAPRSPADRGRASRHEDAGWPSPWWAAWGFGPPRVPGDAVLPVPYPVTGAAASTGYWREPEKHAGPASGEGRGPPPAPGRWYLARSGSANRGRAAPRFVGQDVLAFSVPHRVASSRFPDLTPVGVPESRRASSCLGCCPRRLMRRRFEPSAPPDPGPPSAVQALHLRVDVPRG